MKPDLSWLNSESILSFDTETTGLEESDRPFGVAIAGKFRSEFYDERVYPNIWESIATFFVDTSRIWIGQNIKFDIRMLASKNVFIRGTCFDITSLARLVRNDHMLYSLDAQAVRELGIPKDKTVDLYIKEHKLYNTRRNFFGEDYKTPAFDQVPIDIMSIYAAHDARLTYDLYLHYIKQITPTSTMKQESELIPVCYKMERRGLLLNHEYTLKAMYHEIHLQEIEKNKYITMHGAEFVNSAKSVQKHLDTPLPLTDKGNPSLDDDVLESLVTSGTTRDKETATTVRLIRMYDKRVSTYYKSYLNSMDSQNVIHPTMWIAGTTTGRFSYSDPNFQNMPKEENSTAEYVVRGCIRPRPGKIFVSMDYSQMEYRMAAAYANQSNVIKEVMLGADFHQATAELVGIPRSKAKTLNFAVLYGAGPRKIAGMLGCSVQQAKELQYKYFMNLPKVEKFIDNVVSTGVGRGYVTNWMGRRLYAHKEFCYALPNHLIQGGGADVVKKAMVEIDRNFPDISMVLQVHDQLIFEMTPSELVHVPKIRAIMETVFPPMNGMTLKVDVKYSTQSLAERDMKDLNEINKEAYEGVLSK